MHWNGNDGRAIVYGMRVETQQFYGLFEQCHTLRFRDLSVEVASGMEMTHGRAVYQGAIFFKEGDIESQTAKLERNTRTCYPTAYDAYLSLVRHDYLSKCPGISAKSSTTTSGL